MIESQRTDYIGASEVAAILGKSPFKTPLDVFNAKVDPKPPTTPMSVALEREAPLVWGNLLEPVVGQAFADRNGVELVDAQREYSKGRLKCHIDFRIKETGLPLEVKTTGAYTPQWLGGKPPLHYNIQGQVIMYLMGVDRIHFALLRNTNQYSQTAIDRMDLTVLDRLHEYCEKWWDKHITGGLPPAPTYFTERAAGMPKSVKGHIRANAESLNIINELRDIRHTANELKLREHALKIKLADHIGEHEGVIDDDGDTLAVWQNIKAFDRVKWRRFVEAEGMVDKITDEFKTPVAASRRLKIT